MEIDLKNFFLTVVNNPLPENIEKYTTVLKSIPKESSHYEYALFIAESLKFRTDGHFPITDIDEVFKAFEQQRKGLVKVLDQIVKGKSLYGMKGFQQILKDANLLKPEINFVFDSRDGKTFIVSEHSVYPWSNLSAYLGRSKDSACAHLDYGNIDGIYYLACYSLSAFLADPIHGGQDHIKKCPYCKKYFPATDPRRIRCYVESCRRRDQAAKKRKQRDEKPEIYR